ncbi:MAG: 7TM diverse intracellular signaling domain-containing protein [Bacteroidota bacterium]|nr:7TM diverse intracellular signaling domain-containing protein [Bacteroidota bacterium]
MRHNIYLVYSMSRIYFFILVSVIFLGLSSPLFSQGTMSVAGGEVNIETVDLSKKVFRLSGEWEFCNNKLLTPEEFRFADSVQLKNVPGFWKSGNGLYEQKSFGYGTYRIKIKANKKFKLLSINFNKVQNAYKIWINGQLYREIGRVGRSKTEMRPTWSSEFFVFKNRIPENEIVVQVSNFYHKKGGIELTPYIATPEKVERFSWENLAFDHFIIGLLLIMAIYHFGLFIVKPNEWSVLYFGLLMLSSVSFKITTGEILATTIWPDFNWEFLVKLNYISNYARVMFFALFIGTLFKTDHRRMSMIITAAISIGMSLFIAVTPAIIYTHTLIVFLLYAFVVILFFVGVSIHAVKKKKSGAVYSFIGTMILFITVIHDVLSEIFLLSVPFLTTYGLFIFVLTQAYMLAHRSSYSYQNLAKLNKRLLTLTRIKDELIANTHLTPAAPLKSIASNLNVQKGLALAHMDAGWQIVAEYFNGKITAIPIRKFLNDKRVPWKRECEVKMINQAILSKKTEVQHDEQTGLSTVCLPVKDGDEVVSVFYAQNPKEFGKIDAEKLIVMELLKPQLSVISRNSKAFDDLNKFNEELEIIVKRRTIEIIQQNEELKVQADSIAEQNDIINGAYLNLEKQNQQIKDSINYAQSIQKALFPEKRKIAKLFPEHSIFFKPMHRLSGAFYWAATIKAKGELYSIFAVASAKGLGVPGALMGIIGDSLLSFSVREKGLYRPSEILNSLHQDLIKKLDKKNNNQFESAGIDIGLIALNKKNNKLYYAGAKQPLYLVEDDKLSILKGTDRTCGFISETQEQNLFTDYEVLLKNDSTVFMTAGGFSQQIQFITNEELGTQAMGNLLVKVSNVAIDKHKAVLEEELNKVKGNKSQTGDILVVSIKYKI